MDERQKPEVEQHREHVERFLRSHFEQTLSAQIDRYIRTDVQNIMPLEYFAYASVECREMFVAAQVYGCITVAQSVAEGLSKFLAEKNALSIGNGYGARVARLEKAGVISTDSARAFIEIHGKDRNDFHHLNRGIPTDLAELTRRAEECIRCLFVIESEIFAYTMNEGRASPKRRDYWIIGDDGKMPVYIRAI